ncbi:Phosphatidylglycerol/phosphatidylinositol transfer protein [Aspergillus nanangensis]|uniref:Phosphatidylglycerol/phosphatidylinositol transfer protein n=1 Tax=Aspergillus nanangensis TaxID=2582783 RepID=A0AAD4CFR6_ASPNN|nr:Phosphatidylglycerol/phosphatidylinositol transfer protein [Aspergillus nanangensis]
MKLTTGWIASFIATVSANSWHYTSCDTSEAAPISNIRISPDPPSAGDDVQITFNVDLKETVERGARLDFTMKADGLILKNQQYDICDMVAEKTELECPIQPGQYNYATTINVPLIASGLGVTGQLKAHNANGHALTCAQVDLQF